MSVPPGSRGRIRRVQGPRAPSTSISINTPGYPSSQGSATNYEDNTLYRNDHNAYGRATTSIPDRELAASENSGGHYSEPSHFSLPLPTKRKESRISERSKGQEETRKLLNHLLEELKKAMSESTGLFGRQAPDGGKGDVKGKGREVSDSEAEEDERLVPNVSSRKGKGKDWATTQFELLVQLRDLLIVSEKRGWNLFATSDSFEGDPSPPPSPSSPRSRYNRSNGTRPISPSSLSRFSQTRDLLSGPVLFTSTLSILSEIIFLATVPLTKFRPTMPPLSVQSITIDVAIILNKCCKGRYQDVTALASCMMLALEKWGDGTKGKLLSFFEGLVTEVLTGLQLDHREAGNHSIQTNQPCQPGTATSSAISHQLQLQSLRISQLNSIIPPLLDSIISNISPSTASMDTLYRFHRLISSLISLKSDDIHIAFLEIIAYAETSSTRLLALSIFTTFWPNAIGQAMITGPIPRFNYGDNVWRLEKGTMRIPARASDKLESLIPWHYNDSRSGQESQLCSHCSEPVIGFGLLSTSNGFEAFHLRCHNTPHGSLTSQYSSAASAGQANSSATFKFTTIISHPKRSSNAPLDNQQPTSLRIERHHFQLIHLYTLTLCFLCRKPLWGTRLQGYKCSGCRQFAHHSCITSIASLPSCQFRQTAEITIDPQVLKDSFREYYRTILPDESQLHLLSFEEVSVFRSILLLQQDIFEAGIVAGTMILSEGGTEGTAKAEKFGLHHLLDCHDGLRRSLEPNSAASRGYLGRGQGREGNDMAVDFFDVQYLVYLTAILKSEAACGYSTTGTPGNSILLGSLQEVLHKECAINSRQAAISLLENLLQIGLLERKDAQLSIPLSSPPELEFIFPLPFLIDSSVHVETLIASIESCLKDPSPLVQECGLLLLVRRCFPTPFATHYALDRLSRAVFRWLLDDTALLEITRAQVASVNARYTDSVGGGVGTSGQESKTGGSFLAQRKLLVERLARRWLKALHGLDPPRYATILYDQIVSLSRETRAHRAGFDGDEKNRVSTFDLILRNLMRLNQSETAFTAFEKAIVRWFDEVISQWKDLSSADHTPLSFRPLARLFLGTDHFPPRQSHSFVSPMTVSDYTEEPLAISEEIILDPWSMLIQTANEGKAGLQRSLLWLRLLAQAGVDIPVQKLETYLTLCADPQSPLKNAINFAEALSIASSRRFNRKETAQVVVELFQSQYAYLKSALEKNPLHQLCFVFLKRILASFLLLAGSTLEDLVTLEFYTLHESKAALAINRKRSSFVKTDPAEVECPPEFIESLTYLCQIDGFVIRELVGKFIFALVAGKNAIPTSAEILRQNSANISSYVIRVFDHHQHGLSDYRMKILLVLLSEDSTTFHKLLSILLTEKSWEHRYGNLDSLFLMITELHIPASTTLLPRALAKFFPIIPHFFSGIYDSEEAVRQKCHALIEALRPSHLSVIGSSVQARFNEGRVEQSIEICRFLLSIRAVLPSWQAISWPSLIDELFAQELNSRMAAEKVSTEETAREELSLQLLVIALGYIAEGFGQQTIHEKIKYHTLRALGFPDVCLRSVGGFIETASGRSIPTLGPASFPTLASLTKVLDSAKGISKEGAGNQPGPEDRIADMVLIGASFLDIVPNLVNSGFNLTSLSYVQLRDILECLAISIYKHAIQEKEGLGQAIVEALRRVFDLVLLPTTSYDNRILILVLSTMFLNRYEKLNVPILLHQILVLVQLVSSNASDDGILRQAITFSQSAFLKFGTKGLYVLLFKNIPNDSFFETFGKLVVDGPAVILEGDRSISLREAPFYDIYRQILSATPNRSHSNTSLLLLNLNLYAQKNLRKDWSLELLQDFVQFLARLMRQTIDIDTSDFDHNSTIALLLLAFKGHPQHTHDLLHQLGALLRSWLPRFAFSSETIIAITSITTIHKHDSILASVIVTLDSALSEGLQEGGTISRTTTASLCEALLYDCGAPLTLSRSTLQDRGSTSKWCRILAANPQKLAKEASAFIRASYEGEETFSKENFENLLSVGKILSLTIRLDKDCFELSVISDSPAQNLRLTNLLLLISLYHPLPPSDSLLHHYSSFISQFNLQSLRLSLPSSNPRYPVSLGGIAEILAQAFAGFKLVVLSGERQIVDEYWGVVWPGLERLLNAVEIEGSPLNTIIWTSFSELIIFLHQAGSPLHLLNAGVWSNLLETSGINTSKISAALATFSAPSPRVSREVLIEQVREEVYIAGKLRAQVVRDGG